MRVRQLGYRCNLLTERHWRRRLRERRWRATDAGWGRGRRCARHGCSQKRMGARREMRTRQRERGRQRSARRLRGAKGQGWLGWKEGKKQTADLLGSCSVDAALLWPCNSKPPHHTQWMCCLAPVLPSRRRAWQAGSRFSTIFTSSSLFLV